MKPIYDYINSKDIKKYLQELNYEFKPIEKAWLIYQCKSINYKKKKQALLELIENEQDYIPEREDRIYPKPFHTFIKDYLNAFDNIISEFKKDDVGSIYSYGYYCDGDSSLCEDFESLYSSFEDCKNAYKNDISDYDEKEKEEIKYYRIQKRSTIDRNYHIIVEFSPDDEILDIIACYGSEKFQIMDEDLESFNCLWFDFPVPFEVGDIIWYPENKNFIRYDMDGPFVLKNKEFNNEFIRNNGDSSDMNFAGYFVNPNGTIYSEVSKNYMNIEYYHDELKTNEKVLDPLSKFIKGEISVDVLLLVFRELTLIIESDQTMLHSWNSYYNDWFDTLGIR